MLSPADFVITLGRAVELARAAPDQVEEQKALLRKLVALSSLGDLAVRPAAHGLSAGAEHVPATLPGVDLLASQLEAHAVRELRVARNTGAAALLALIRALAVSLGGFQDERGIGAHLAGLDAAGVTLVTAHPEPPAPPPPPVTDPAPPRPPPPDPDATPLEAGLARLDADFMGPEALSRASRVGREIAAAIAEGRAPEATQALARLVRLEAGLAESSPRRSLGIVLHRLLTPAALPRIVPMLFVPERRADAVAVLHRAGAAGAEALLTGLAAAETLQERRVYFDAVRESDDAMAAVLRLLEDERWHVVRNVAELAGELGIEAAVPRLGRLLEHEDTRVRRAAAVALARIGTPGTADLLRRALRESDTEVRALVAGAVQDRPSAPLAMPLALAAVDESDPELVREYCRALGRIGTADAIRALERVARPGGLIFGRKPVAPRLAAVEGLRVAGNPAAVAALRRLTRDRSRAIRRAVRAALAEPPGG